MYREPICIIIACLIGLVASGCQNGPQDNDEMKSHFLYSHPADGGTIPTGSGLLLKIGLFFDQPPLRVTIRGQSAEIDNHKVTWTGFSEIDFPTGRTTLPINWVNPDGSKGEGAVITLYVIIYDGDGPSYVSGSFDGGNENLDPDVLNHDGIVMEFDAPIVATTLVLALGESIRESRPLNWTQKVESKTIRFERFNGEPLHFNKTYIIYGTLTGPVNYYKTDMLNRFTTKESAVEREDEEE